MTAPHLREVSAATMSHSLYESRITSYVNYYRVHHGLAKLSYGSCVKPFAVGQSRNLLEAGELYHQSMMRILYSCDGYRDAENIAYGSVTPRHMVRMWMDSPGHRANLLDPRMHRLASGAARSSSGRWWASQVFLTH